MKTRSIIIAGLLSIAFFTSRAQSENPVIKVLPTSQSGIVKLLVVGTDDESVEVKFFNKDGLVQSDAIKPVSRSFNKKYDLRRVIDKSFSMEVTASGTSVRYELAKHGDKLTPVLTKETQTYRLIASND